MGQGHRRGADPRLARVSQMAEEASEQTISMTAPIRSMPAFELLPPPMPARWRVIAAARRRGISDSEIAAALGASRQRVAQIIKNYERRSGCALPLSAGYHRELGAKSLFICANCGSSNWLGKKFLSRGRGFCSVQCRGLFDREMSANEIKVCIDSRVNGATWKGLSQMVGRDYQVIQASIWRYLYEGGRLTTDNLEKIWRAPGHSPRANWQWLIANTGIDPR